MTTESIALLISEIGLAFGMFTYFDGQKTKAIKKMVQLEDSSNENRCRINELEERIEKQLNKIENAIDKLMDKLDRSKT